MSEVVKLPAILYYDNGVPQYIEIDKDSKLIKRSFTDKAKSVWNSFINKMVIK